LALIFHLQSSLIYGKESERWTEEEMFGWTVIGPVCLDNKEDITRQQKKPSEPLQCPNKQQCQRGTSSSAKDDSVKSSLQQDTISKI